MRRETCVKTGRCPIPPHFLPLAATIGRAVGGVNGSHQNFVTRQALSDERHAHTRGTEKVTISDLRAVPAVTCQETTVFMIRWRRKWESADKPVLSRQSFLWDARRRAPQAAYPEARAGRALRLSPRASLFGLAPAGLPCRRRYRRRGALLPHHFNLTVTLARAWAVSFLLHFPWARAPQALPGAVPCGARTFLRILANTAIAWPTPAHNIVRRAPVLKRNREASLSRVSRRAHRHRHGARRSSGRGSRRGGRRQIPGRMPSVSSSCAATGSGSAAPSTRTTASPRRMSASSFARSASSPRPPR